LESGTRVALAAAFFVFSVIFIYRSFYGMRIKSDEAKVKAKAKPVETTA
jgi:K(+)-stimulated pyrophosphate-energized sodium pump